MVTLTYLTQWIVTVPNTLHGDVNKLQLGGFGV